MSADLHRDKSEDILSSLSFGNINEAYAHLIKLGLKEQFRVGLDTFFRNAIFSQVLDSEPLTRIEKGRYYFTEDMRNKLEEILTI